MPGGVVAVSVMLQVKGETPDADVSSSGLHRIVSKLSQVDKNGDSQGSMIGPWLFIMFRLDIEETMPVSIKCPCPA